VRALELRVVATPVREAVTAGASPKRRPVTKETARVKSRTVRSGVELMAM
jgi:septum formation inhibitor MinC